MDNKPKDDGKKKIIILIILLLLLFLVVILFFAIPSASKNSGLAILNKANDCKAVAAKYDGKVMKISSSDKFKGEIGIKADKQTCQYSIVWHEAFESPNIIKNNKNSLSPVSDYSYQADVVFAKESRNPLDGSISPIFQNKDQLPTDPFSLRFPNIYITNDVLMGKDKKAVAIAFSHTMEQSGTISQSTIDEILAVKQIKIYDANTKSNTPVAEFNVNISW